jgi:hypothetical protein
MARLLNQSSEAGQSNVENENTFARRSALSGGVVVEIASAEATCERPRVVVGILGTKTFPPNPNCNDWREFVAPSQEVCVRDQIS